MKKSNKILIILLSMGIVFSCENTRSMKKERFKSNPIIHKNVKVEEIIDTANKNVLVKEKVNETPHNTNEYNYLKDNSYKLATKEPLSTFSIDVDNASYSEVRQSLVNGNLPYKDAVRIEEMINYFDYNYEQPKGDKPFSVYTEMAKAPWNENHNLVMIGIKGKELDYDNLKAGNLVFLIDTSGSMSAENKLPLLIRSFKVLVNNLPKGSRISIVTYAGSAGLILPSTDIKDKEKIIKALDNLQSGGSTAGAAGINLAYKIATENFIENGNNRVILATDGDFNIGVSSTSELIRMIQEKKKTNIFLSVLGFGMGNYKDGRMEEISNKGNGNYFYIDNYSEAKKVFQKDLVANMFTIAKDVKIQVEFNPKKVKAYRLIGYANRLLNAEDFNNDKIDAGELGAGHTVTAFYEIISASSNEKVNSIDNLKYQKVSLKNNSNELMTLKLRYKPIKSDKSKLISIAIKEESNSWKNASIDFKFASSVAGFGMLLRDSEFKGNVNSKLLRTLAVQNKETNDSYKNEFITLIDKYEDLVKDKNQ